MDKYSAVQKTLIALVLATMALAVAIPMLFFISVSFSNSVEMSQFPKNLFASGSVTVRIVPHEKGSYELFYDYGRGDGWESVITSSNANRMENHFLLQYGVAIDGDELLDEWAATRENGPMEFTYSKRPFNNFIQFFKIVPNAASRLKGWCPKKACFTGVRVIPNANLLRYTLFRTKSVPIAADIW